MKAENGNILKEYKKVPMNIGDIILFVFSTIWTSLVQNNNISSEKKIKLNVKAKVRTIIR